MKDRFNVLIVGGGGREHAIAWKISHSSLAGKVFVSPGNAGTSKYNVPIPATEIRRLGNFAKENDCLTIVGPEVPLEMGLVDEFHERGLKVFGPNREQAKLETSKAFSKTFMIENNIPTARFEIFSDYKQAIDYSASLDGDVVVKADGLASGKGVFVCRRKEEAFHAIKSIMVDRIFGNSGDKVVLEERLVGEEASLMAICDGNDAIEFGTAVDHKRLLDGDAGPNTGGMGAYSPAGNLGEEQAQELMQNVVRPTVRKTRFEGFFYTGLILTSKGPKVLEFNARLGDPETQVILPRLESDLLQILVFLCEGASLRSIEPLSWSLLYCCGVVMCSQGYPQVPSVGAEIMNIESFENERFPLVFHAGTKRENGRTVTNGGRVLCISEMGETLGVASRKAYDAVSKITWEGEFHRRDIGSPSRGFSSPILGLEKYK